MYDYQIQKGFIFTEDGQRMFLKIRDNARRLIREAGSARMDKIIACASGDGWNMLACVDRMVELGEIIEVTKPGTVAGQHRIFTVLTSL